MSDGDALAEPCQELHCALPCVAGERSAGKGLVGVYGLQALDHLQQDHPAGRLPGPSRR